MCQAMSVNLAVQRWSYLALLQCERNYSTCTNLLCARMDQSVDDQTGLINEQGRAGPQRWCSQLCNASRQRGGKDRENTAMFANLFANCKLVVIPGRARVEGWMWREVRRIEPSAAALCQEWHEVFN